MSRDLIERAVRYAMVTGRPLPSFYESWQDNTYPHNMNPNIWAHTDPAFGAAWSNDEGQTYGARFVVLASPNASENCRLVALQRCPFAAGNFDTRWILRKGFLEFEVGFITPANITAASAFMGLTPAAANDRTTDNIIGWGINSPLLVSITDSGSVETTNNITANLALFNKLKLEVDSVGVRFYLNDALVANHITNYASKGYYPNFYIPTGVGGPATIILGNIRIWYEEVV